MAKFVPDPDPKKSIDEQVNAFEWPMIADEIYIQKKTPPKKEETKKEENKEQQESKTDWGRIGFFALIFAGIALIGLIFFPLFYFVLLLFRVSRSGTAGIRAERLYRLAMYTYHMSGDELQLQTALEYAQGRIDPRYGNHFVAFVQLYLKLKYSSYQASAADEELITSFAGTFRVGVRRKLNSFKSISRWFHLPRALRYFRTPAEQTETENKHDEHK